MDTITHGITGALVGKAFLAERHGRPATVAVTLGAVFPDSDVFFELFAPNELATLEWHRGVTHSFVALPVFAALLAGLTRRLLRNKPRPRFLTLWGFYALGLAVHILLDLITSFGTIIWSPLRATRAAWDWTFIIDFAFTATVLLPQVAAWIYRERGGAPRRGVLVWLFFSVFAVGAASVVAPVLEIAFPTRVVLLVSSLLAGIFLLPAVHGWGLQHSRAAFCRIGVGALAGYLALCGVNHHLAVKRVEAYAREQALMVKNLGALPAPLSPFRWTGLILTRAGVYQSQFSLLDPSALAFAFFPSAEPNPYIELAENLPSVKTFRWFARFPVVRYRKRGHGAGTLHLVDYTDLRFGGLIRRRGAQSNPGDAPPAFTFRVVINARGEEVSAGFLGV
ncbi:MAG: metal-dependent hydrolase [Acidobacteria bacterium]|nr:metal-dependent hydrolase [Acidobacteriota bacterium]